jgi:thiol-disulfide isomerase/thioredoxin
MAGRVRIAMGGILLVSVVAVSGCSTSGSDTVNRGGFVLKNGVVVVPADQRKQAPVLSGPLLGGGHADLADDLGKVVVLNLWGSWCAPCREEAPALAQAARRLPGAVFMGINTRDLTANAEAFVRVQRIPYPSFVDQDGSLVLQMERVINMSSLPVTVVLDKRGRVAAALYGPVTALTLEELVHQVEREQ